MKKILIQEEFSLYEGISDLPLEDQQLMFAAISNLELSYAPYSKFRVAAAILLENGELIAGANQENSSYPLCLCAERVALHHAAMRFPDVRIKTMAITANNPERNDLGPIPPCGACRQVIAEYQQKLKGEIRLLLKGDLDEILEIQNISQILPFGFDGNYLPARLA